MVYEGSQWTHCRWYNSVVPLYGSTVRTLRRNPTEGDTRWMYGRITFKDELSTPQNQRLKMILNSDT